MDQHRLGGYSKGRHDNATATTGYRLQKDSTIYDRLINENVLNDLPNSNNTNNRQHQSLISPSSSLSINDSQYPVRLGSNTNHQSVNNSNKAWWVKRQPVLASKTLVTPQQSPVLRMIPVDNVDKVKQQWDGSFPGRGVRVMVVVDCCTYKLSVYRYYRVWLWWLRDYSPFIF